MSDQRPGSNNNKDPWGRDKTPPSLEELMSNFKKQLFGGGSGGKGTGSPGSSDPAIEGRLVTLGLFLLLILWFLGGIYIVAPAENAVVTQFGRYYETQGPGMHWIPLLIRSRDIVNIERINTVAVHESMLTKDENIVELDLSVFFRVSNPKDFLFNVNNPINSLRLATSSSVRHVIGGSKLDDILTKGRADIRDQINEQLKDVLNSYQAGLDVTSVNLQPARPPEAVTEAFNNAIKAREEREAFINQAKAYQEREVRLAKGHSARILELAEADRQKILLDAKAQTASFSAILPQYLRNPALTKQRIYLDIMQDIFEHTSKVLVDSDVNNLMYLPLDRMSRPPGKSLTQADVVNQASASIPAISHTSSDAGVSLRPTSTLRRVIPTGRLHRSDLGYNTNTTSER